MSKRWSTNKTNPKAYEDIIVIVKNWPPTQVEISYCFVNDYHELVYYDDNLNPLWKDFKKDVKLWAYVDKYFAKELKNEPKN